MMWCLVTAFAVAWGDWHHDETRSEMDIQRAIDKHHCSTDNWCTLIGSKFQCMKSLLLNYYKQWEPVKKNQFFLLLPVYSGMQMWNIFGKQCNYVASQLSILTFSYMINASHIGLIAGMTISTLYQVQDFFTWLIKQNSIYL